MHTIVTARASVVTSISHGWRYFIYVSGDVLIKILWNVQLYCGSAANTGNTRILNIPENTTA